MGTTVSKKIDEVEKKQDATKIQLKSDLTALNAILTTKEKEFRQKIITPNEADKTLPIGTIVRIRSEKIVDVSAGPSEKLNEMVEDMFGGEFLKGMRGLILGTLDTVLGRASAGEEEKSGYSVMFLHNAIVRIDYMTYAYTFRSDGVTTQLQNGLVFCSTISTVKLSKVNPETIALLAGFSAENSRSYIQRQRKMCDKFVEDIKKNSLCYDTAFCIGKIRGYFGGDLTVEEKEKLASFYEEPTSPAGPGTGPGKKATPETPVVDTSTAKRKEANELLQSLAAKHSVEKSAEDDITDQQNKLLDNMKDIYLKINEMKAITGTGQEKISAP